MSMQDLIRRALGLALFAVVAVGLAFGASTAFASSLTETCGDDLGELGTCPPYDGANCNYDCFQMYGTGGSCILTETQGEMCCACII
jgi:hypothetical protein